jgi:hypothetical protein
MANGRTLATVAKPPLAKDVDDFAFSISSRLRDEFCP